jgi:hypothetical protein
LIERCGTIDPRRLRFYNQIMTARISIACLLLIASLTFSYAVPTPVPARLTDDQFWKAVSTSSEQDGTFNSDNLVSNEIYFQEVIPDLLSTAKQGGVYLGVGPEQNFTYISVLKPLMAFIVDIRRGNLDVHLMYKALFELSEDRTGFVSRLFSRKRPPGLNSKSTAREIFNAYLSAESSKELFDSSLKAIIDQLKTKHGFSLSAGDIDGIHWALDNYYRFGPSIDYTSSRRDRVAPAIVGATQPSGPSALVTYAALMIADDGSGEMHSYLTTEESFEFLKELETRNMLIPVVGDFAGPKAIREIGKYVKSLDAVVSAFYLSNVENYLDQGNKIGVFFSNVASLPLNQTSTFIRYGRVVFPRSARRGATLGNMVNEVRPYVDPSDHGVERK